MSWRTVDIVVTAAIAVAFGVVYWAWGVLFTGTTAAFAFLPPAQYILSGVWLIAGVLAGLIVRKPGAALFAETVAASVSILLGSPWSLDVALSGLYQGAGAELAFAIFRYRRWDLMAAILAAALAAVGEWLHDIPLYFPATPFPEQLLIGVFMLVSALLFAGFGTWWLFRALVQTGVLAQFPAGRSQQRI
ncbi:MAG TPA: ECF transporter S component [Candidatus Limnocylindria bacterium]|nr:ECF transporter S component [Candidatus Limnocylindria bacterium]